MLGLAQHQVIEIFGWTDSRFTAEQMVEMGIRKADLPSQVRNRKLAIKAMMDQVQSALDSWVRRAMPPLAPYLRANGTPAPTKLSEDRSDALPT